MLSLIHPAVVHFAIAFAATGAATEAWGLLRRSERVERLGSMMSNIGTLWLIPALLTGTLAKNTVDPGPLAAVRLGLHEKAGFVTLALFVASRFWRAWGGGKIDARQRYFYVALLLLALAALAFGSFLGGELVYRHGLAVGGR